MRSLAIRWMVAALTTLFLVWGAFSFASDPDLKPLVVQTTAGPQTFMIELADDPGERQRGLMFRRELAADRGMLFDNGREEVVHMWMKNTFIPLDMLFIARDGRIAGIVENAEPQSERVLSSEVPVRGVLELPGGTAERLEIKVGDRVRHPLFETAAP